MKLRIGVMAATMATCAMLITGLAGASPAFAATYHPICITGGTTCILGHGYNQQVTLRNGGPTNFYQVNGATWQGHTVYEYQQVGTNNCLTYDASDSGFDVLMYTCGRGNPSQLWWLSNSGTIVNDYGTYQHSAQYCLEGNTLYNTVDTNYCSDGTQGYDHENFTY